MKTERRRGGDARIRIELKKEGERERERERKVNKLLLKFHQNLKLSRTIKQF